MKSLSVKLGVVVIVIGFPILCYGANMIARIDRYSLGQDIKTIPDLVEFTPEEYVALWSGGVGLPNEKVFKAPKVTFNTHLWNLVVGALNGKIYKLALQYISSDQAEIQSLFEETLEFGKSQMGVPTEQTMTPRRYVWDSTDGNVVLTERQAVGFWYINLFLTSRGVK